jgi:hypothetical protein
MFKLDLVSSRRVLGSVGLGLLFLVSFGARPVLGQADAELRGRVDRLYAVRPVPDGLELRFKEGRPDVESVVVTGSEVRVNGARLPEEVVRQWLGSDAAPVLALSRLSREEARRVFDLGISDLEPVAPPPPPEPAEAPESPEPAAAPEADDEPGKRRTGDQLSVFDDLVVEASEAARNATAVFGSVDVLGDVRGDVVAVFGDVDIEGEVDGEVTAVHGSVHLGPAARVARGVTSVGGEIEREPGSEVGGNISEVPLLGMGGSRHGGDPRWWMGMAPWWNGGGRVWSFFWYLIQLGLVALLMSALWLIFPRQVRRVERAMTGEWWKAAVVGLLTWVLFLPAVAVILGALVITVVGCLLVVPVGLVAFLVFPAALLLGYTAGAKRIGELFAERFGWQLPGGYAAILLGLGVLESAMFIARLLMAVGGFLVPVGWLFALVGLLVRFCVATLGLGGVVLTRFGSRPADGPADWSPPSSAPEPPWTGAGPGADRDEPEPSTQVTLPAVVLPAPEPPPTDAPPPPDWPPKPTG